MHFIVACGRSAAQTNHEELSRHSICIPWKGTDYTKSPGINWRDTSAALRASHNFCEFLQYKAFGRISHQISAVRLSALPVSLYGLNHLRTQPARLGTRLAYCNSLRRTCQIRPQSNCVSTLGQPEGQAAEAYQTSFHRVESKQEASSKFCRNTYWHEASATCILRCYK